MFDLLPSRISGSSYTGEVKDRYILKADLFYRCLLKVQPSVASLDRAAYNKVMLGNEGFH